MSLPAPLTHENLDKFKLLEFIILVGAAGSGKSHSILSLAEAWSRLEPKGRVYCLDVESKLGKEYKIAYPDLTNLSIWYGDQVDTMDKFLAIYEELSPSLRDIDWLCIESDTRVWAMAQDMGWLKVTGRAKEDWMSLRVATEKEGRKAPPVTPDPQDLWQVVYDAYRRRYRDYMANRVSMKTNVLYTTGISTKQKTTAARKQSAVMIDMLDIQPDGHAENTRIPDTVILMTKEGGRFQCTVKKDRGHDVPGETIQFDPGENFWFSFMEACRG